MNHKPTIDAPSPPAAGSGVLTEIVLCAWFLLVGVTFWAPYVVPITALRPGLTTALYGVFLLIFAGAAALSGVRRWEERRRGR